MHIFNFMLLPDILVVTVLSVLVLLEPVVVSSASVVTVVVVFPDVDVVVLTEDTVVVAGDSDGPERCDKNDTIIDTYKFKSLFA